MGYENASDYEGGKQDWIEAGLPVERVAEENGDPGRRK
jgi:rhodanese-related sulfurtransferase